MKEHSLIEVRINLDSATLSSVEDALELKYQIIDGIEEEGIGLVTGSGLGGGQIDLDVEVASPELARIRIEALLLELGLLARASLRHFSRPTDESDEDEGNLGSDGAE